MSNNIDETMKTLGFKKTGKLQYTQRLVSCYISIDLTATAAEYYFPVIFQQVINQGIKMGRTELKREFHKIMIIEEDL